MTEREKSQFQSIEKFLKRDIFAKNRILLPNNLIAEHQSVARLQKLPPVLDKYFGTYISKFLELKEIDPNFVERSVYLSTILILIYQGKEVDNYLPVNWEDEYEIEEGCLRWNKGFTQTS